MQKTSSSNIFIPFSIKIFPNIFTNISINISINNSMICLQILHKTPSPTFPSIFPSIFSVLFSAIFLSNFLLIIPQFIIFFNSYPRFYAPDTPRPTFVSIFPSKSLRFIIQAGKAPHPPRKNIFLGKKNLDR